MALCEYLIVADIESNCANPIYAGHEQLGFIINRADIASYVKNDGVVSSITLKSGKVAYHIYQPSKQPFNGSTTTLNEGAVTNKVDKNVSFVVLNDGPDVCRDIIDPALNGEFVAIIARKWEAGTRGDGKWIIVGLDKGARVTALEKDPDSEDTDGGWSITLTETATPNSGVFYFHTDLQTTEAELEALTVAGGI